MSKRFLFYFGAKIFVISLWSQATLAKDLSCQGQHPNGSKVRVSLSFSPSSSYPLTLQYLGPIDNFGSDIALETRDLTATSIPYNPTPYWSGPVRGEAGRLYVEKLAGDPTLGPRKFVYLGQGRIVSLNLICR